MTAPLPRVERRDETSWRVLSGDEEIAVATAWVRPDGRCTVSISTGTTAEVLGRLVSTIAAAIPNELLVNVRAGNQELRDRFAALGFREKRTEAAYRVGVAVAAARLGSVDLPPGISSVPLSTVEESTVRELDDVLRQDVPGTDGWVWPEEAFREETFGPWLDPDLYRVAVDDATLAPVGIARLWVHEARPPRLGFIGTVRSHRKTGIARALLAEIFRGLSRRGVDFVTTEADVENTASTTLLLSLGAERVGGYVELSLAARPAHRPAGA